MPFRMLVIAALLFAESASAQEAFSRFETFDRYDPTGFAYEVKGVAGEHIDLRTLGVSWEVDDYVIPGTGGLDIVISRSFNRLAHTPSDMGHWYFGVPRIQIPTSPWRGAYDPSYPSIGTFFAAWNNLWSRTDYGAASICERAGALVDQTVTGSLSGQTKGGIFFAAPISLYIPGEGAKLLLERADAASQFGPYADYVTTDNWTARCLPPGGGASWGGFEVRSPRGVRYVFDTINYLVPGEYAYLSAGGWVEMGISRVEDAHGNRLDYRYDDSTGLLSRIEASDGRVVELGYHPGSVLGVDVQGSPLALLNRVDIHADGDVISILYDYCDFVDYYLLNQGCTPLDLGADQDLPVLQAVRYPDGSRVDYRYDPDVYSANVKLDWGNFEFQLQQVVLPTGGTIHYEYQPGYHPVLQQTDAPAPRLALRATGGRDVEAGEWRYTYAYADHIETTTVTGPDRVDRYEFYEGLGTYEFRIARYPGQHSWPDSAPTDYDELLGQLRRQRISAPGSAEVLREINYDYALLPHIGKQYYSGNWLGWPTLVLAQTRPIEPSRVETIDQQSRSVPVSYAVQTAANEFDVFGYPEIVRETGHSPAGPVSRTTALFWHHEPAAGLIGLPAGRANSSSATATAWQPGLPLVSRSDDNGVVTDYEYTAGGDLSAASWVQNGVLHRRTLSEYHRGRAQRIQDPVDPVAGEYRLTRRGIDDLGRIAWSEDGAANRTLYSYDPLGRVARVQPALGHALQIEYQINGNNRLSGIRQVQGPRERLHTLDGFGRTLELREFDRNAVDADRALRWAYDALGRPVFRSLPFDPTRQSSPFGTLTTHDLFGRPTSELATADGGQRSWCYSWRCVHGDAAAGGMEFANGYLLTDERGYQSVRDFVAYGSPEAGWLARSSDQISAANEPDGPRFRESRFAYDDSGQLLSVAQGQSGESLLTREFSYAETRLTVERHPETGETRHAYDERGNRVLSRTGTSPQVRRQYDGLQRLSAVDYGSTEADIDFDYDAAGNLVRARNGNSDWLYAYDAANRLITEVLRIDDRSFVLSHTFDALGNRSATVYPSGLAIDYAPDAAGRPTRAGDVATNVRYWPDDMLRSLVYGNGVVADFTSGPAGLPAERRFSAASGSPLTALRYTYDLSHNVSGLQNPYDASAAAAFGYDGLGRLTLADGYWGTGVIDYDATGNILAKRMGGHSLTYQYGADDNLLAAFTVNNSFPFNVTHEARGNMTSNGLYDFSYDSAGQLAGVAQLEDLAYRYDANGRRVKTTDDSGPAYSLYDATGSLRYLDGCDQGGQISEFVYLDAELVGRVDSDCEGSCHP